jgi:hypothetical protein
MTVFFACLSLADENPYSIEVFASYDGALTYFAKQGFKPHGRLFIADEIERKHVKGWIAERVLHD